MAEQDVADAEILAEFRATTVVFARPEFSGPPPPVLTAEEQAEGVRLAREHDRRVKPPLQAIRVSRETGKITGTARRWNPPMQGLMPKVHAPTGTSRRVRPAQRQREQRPRRVTRSAPSRGDPHLPADDDDEIERLRGNARAAGMVHISELLDELRRWAA